MDTTEAARRLATLAATLLAGCASALDSPRREDLLTVPLRAGSRNAGATATASLLPQGDSTAIAITVGSAPPWVGRPVHLYTFLHRGSCARHDPTPALSMNEVVRAGLFSASSNGPFFLKKTAPVPLDELRAAGYALVVRSAPADGDFELFCGEIR